MSATGKTSKPPRAKARVLVIDDDPPVARAVGRGLGKDFDCVVVTDPREALARALGGEAFDAIVCDYRMTAMSGAEFYAALAKAGSPMVAKMVIASGSTGQPDFQRFITETRVRHIAKPFETSELRSLIRALTGS